MPPGGRLSAAKVVTAVAAVVALLAAVLFVGIRSIPADEARIDVVLGVDDKTSSVDAARLRDLIVPAASNLAAAGPTTLATWVVSGTPAELVTETDLQVMRGGGPELDDTLRTTEVTRRIDTALDSLISATPSGDGRSLWAATSPLASVTPSGSWDIYLVTFGMPAGVDPEDTRLLTATDAETAVSTLPESLFPDLAGATVHVIFLPPAGEQENLSAVTAGWRSDYLERYIRATNASVGTFVEMGGRGEAAPGAPSAPVIENIPSLTVSPPAPPQADAPVEVVIGGALFKPASDELIDRQATLAALQPLADAWATGAYTAAECTARAARFGTAENARSTTDLRADVAVELLASLGIPNATPISLGYDQPLPGYDPQAPEQRSLSCSVIP